MSICEHVQLSVVAHQVMEFIDQFKVAEQIISRQPGYQSHRLIQHHDVPNQFILLIDWDHISSHRDGFRKSADYLMWKSLLHRFYDPFPTVTYYHPVS